MPPWPLLGIAQLIVAMNDTLPQLGTAVRMLLPGYGWVVEGSVARLEASHTVHGLDSKRTSRHTRKEILSCIAHKQKISQQQILQFKPQLLQKKEPTKWRDGRQAAFVLQGVWRRPNCKGCGCKECGGSQFKCSVQWHRRCIGSGSGAGSDNAAGRCDGEGRV